MSYRLTTQDMSTFPNLPHGLVDARGRTLAALEWDFQEHEVPFFISRIHCTHMHFASERDVLGCLAYGVVNMFPATLAAFLSSKHKTSLPLAAPKPTATRTASATANLTSSSK